eukprot:gene12420-4000_t
MLYPLLAVVSVATANKSPLPSFLMILGDDIGWADFKWNNGTANTPRMAEWAARAGSILMQDSHSGGTVCSPTRGSVLTGRTPLRDCINGVYGCSDMTECVPDFEFAPQGTFTIGMAARAASKDYVSQNGTTCTESASSGPLLNLSDAQLDFYACLNELDHAVGRVLDALDTYGYGHNTLTWLATDNGPEVNCEPEGECLQSHYRDGPGSAVPLRGRKRDVWEGGHRIPSIISWPAVVQGSSGRVSWEQVVTHDFLATIMDVLNVSRPAEQADWGVDGRSVLPLLKAPPAAMPQTKAVYADGTNVMPIHPMGWMYNGWNASSSETHLAFRYGQWKFVRNSKSCSNDDCKGPQLFDLATDLGETTDVSAKYPDIFEAIQANFTVWSTSVLKSITDESQCQTIGPAPPPAPPPPPGPPSNACNFVEESALDGENLLASVYVTSKEECCGTCAANPQCKAAAFHGKKSGKGKKGANCMLRKQYTLKAGAKGDVVCLAPNNTMHIAGADDEKDWIIDES